MPRRSREEGPGAIHHAFGHAVANEPLFVDEDDMRAYLALLGEVTTIYEWNCLGYCLMTNHVHLLVETPEPNLGSGMQRLHGSYATRFNRRHQSAGHRFHGRYGNRRIKSDEHFYAAVRYIARNPVEAGLCALPEEYPWSSHAGVVTRRTAPWLDQNGLLSFFGSLGGMPLDRYRRLVTEG